MTDWSDRVPRAWRRIVAGMLWLSAISLAGLAAVTIADVLGRNSHLPGIPGIIEWTHLAMIVIAMAGLPSCCLRGEHIAVDIATRHLTRGFQRGLDGLWLTVTVVVLGALTWLSIDAAIGAHEGGLRSQSLGWSPLFLAAAAAIGMVAAAATGLLALRPRRSAPGDEPPTVG